MSSEAPRQRITYTDYCALEREAEVKHEYLRGEVFAMAGGTPEHGLLSTRVLAQLTVLLRDRPCGVYNSDVRVRVEATDLDTYPDASVVCGQPQTASSDGHALVNPIMLVEVLSPSTEAYDRGQKAAHYRRIPSLRAYVMVAQDERRLELQLRQDDGGWTLLEAGPGERLTIAPLGIEIEVDEIYRDPYTITGP